MRGDVHVGLTATDEHLLTEPEVVMADRGQITGGVLAFDNAITRAAAAIKKIASPVARDADILLAPDLEAGNMSAKQLSYVAGADSAGIALGARVPVILTSRADTISARLASVAIAQLRVMNAGSSSLKFALY